MVFGGLWLRGCCVAVSLGLGASLRRGHPISDTEHLLPRKLHGYNASVALQREAGEEAAVTSSRYSPRGWLRSRAPRHKAFFDLHIPKTAGVSFAIDAARILPRGIGLFSEEMCFRRLRNISQWGDRAIALLRNPVSHVYSQFLECKYDEWGKSTVMHKDLHIMANVTTWLQHFDGGKQKYDLHCYHPYNMQTRAFLCSGSCHHLQEEPNLKQALRNLDSLFFVGIADRYHASLCLFYAKTRVKEPLPQWCNCENKAAWKAFPTSHLRHNVPKHSLRNLTETDVAMVKQLTKLDQQLYDHALERFHREVEEVRLTKGMKILCD